MRIYHKNVFILILLVSLFGMACDPCRQMAERICNCKEPLQARQDCISQLSLAPLHEGFLSAKRRERCERDLEICVSCEKINNKDDTDCKGNYRYNEKK